jgi:hypothetical protein
MKDFSSWDELIQAFRKIGGIADNVMLGTGPSGRGLFAKDPSRPVRLHVPDHVLLSAKDLEVHGEDLRVRSEANVSPEVRDFSNAYYRFTSWSDGGRAGVEAFFIEMQGLPPQVQDILSRDFGLGPFLSGPSPENILARFIQTRAINANKGLSLMPVMDLVNHAVGPALNYNFASGVTLEGQVLSEILALYTSNDSWGIFCNFGFPEISRFAFSERYGSKKDSLSVTVHKKPRDHKLREDNLPGPVVSRNGNEMELSLLIIGDRHDPTTPVNIFLDAVGDFFGSEALRFFEHLLLLNRLKFHKLLAATEDCDRPLAKVIHRACRLQLEAMAACFVGAPRRKPKRKDKPARRRDREPLPKM